MTNLKKQIYTIIEWSNFQEKINLDKLTEANQLLGIEKNVRSLKRIANGRAYSKRHTNELLSAIVKITNELQSIKSMYKNYRQWCKENNISDYISATLKFMIERVYEG